MDINIYKAYISGALSNVWEKVKLKTLYEDIGELCKKKGIEPYIPHKNISLDKDPEFSVELMYKSNMKNVDEADLLIGYVGTPSQGTGMEIERANLKGAEVIVLSEKNKKISRMVRGCPAVRKLIFFSTFEDAMSQLEEAIDKWLETKRKEEKIESGIH